MRRKNLNKELERLVNHANYPQTYIIEAVTAVYYANPSFGQINST